MEAQMSEEFQRLRRAARQVIETDRMLAGEFLAPGSPLPARKAAPPARKAAPPAAPAPPRPAAGPGTGKPRVDPINPVLRTDEDRRKAAELEALEAGEVRGCTKCGLCKGRRNVVFGEGHPNADIVFIGEGPGQEEDKLARPFVGRAGELLTKMIKAMGLRRDEVYIGNVVKCRPPGNRAPAAEEVEACHDHLLGQLRIIQPKVIVALGNPATHALLNTTTGITRLRGRWQPLPMLDPDLAGIKVMPTFHPAFLLRSYTEDNRAKVWSDLQEVMKELGIGKKS
jgi:uracil-DNA glycosylase family 4